MAWVAVWGIAVALNVVPAFMPPTWAMLAYFHFYHALPIVPLAIIGALGATTGRALLAIASRAFGDRFVPASARANIEELVEVLGERPTLALPTLALFALGPIPSNHLFIAAGLARAPLLPILAVFCIARCVSYIIWVSAANAADQSLRDLLGPQIGGWEIILIQALGFGLIILSLRVNWRRVLGVQWPAGQPERNHAAVGVEHPAPPDETAAPQSAPSTTPWSSHRE